MADNSKELVVIDDDKFIEYKIQRYLRGTEWRLNFFSEAEDAIEHLVTHKATVLIVDIRMPKMEGHEILELLSEKGRLVETRVYVSSSVAPLTSVWSQYKKYNAAFISKDQNIHEFKRLLG